MLSIEAVPVILLLGAQVIAELDRKPDRKPDEKNTSMTVRALAAKAVPE